MTTRLNSNERSIVITALRHALPYLRVYKHKVFVLKAGGDAFVSAETTRALMEQIGILHQVGIRVVARARRRTAVDGARETLGARDADGRGPARHGCADARGLDDGAERRDQHAHRRRLPRARHSGDRLQRRRRRPDQGDQAAARAGRRPNRRLRFRRRHLGARHEHLGQAARQRPRADREPAVGRRPRHRAQHQRRHGRRDDRVRPQGREIRHGYGRAGHSRVARRSTLADLVHRPRGPKAAARRRQDLGRHAAEGCRHRARACRAACRACTSSRTRKPTACCSRCSRTKARARSSSTTRKRCDPRNRRASTMARLWDKGLPLDERILRFTAGEDHRLDERLVEYDARASIAHARMLEKQKLLARCRLQGDLRGSRGVGRRARGRRVVDRARRRGRAQRARAAAHGAHRRGRRPSAPRPLAQRSGARRVAALSARCDRGARDRKPTASSRRSSALPSSKARSPCPATRTCSRRCRARSRCGPAASAQSSPTIAPALQRVRERTDLNPLGSAAGYGVPNLPLDREATRAALGFARNAGTRDGRSAVARQSRSRARVRDRRIARRPRPACVRLAPLLYERVRVRGAAAPR